MNDVYACMNVQNFFSEESCFFFAFSARELRWNEIKEGKEKKLTLMIFFSYFLFLLFASRLLAYPLISFSLFVCPSQLPLLITHSLSEPKKKKPKTISAIPQAALVYFFVCNFNFVLFLFHFSSFSLKTSFTASSSLHTHTRS